MGDLAPHISGAHKNLLADTPDRLAPVARPCQGEFVGIASISGRSLAGAACDMHVRVGGIAVALSWSIAVGSLARLRETRRMAERRQTARFALAVPMDAHIGVLQDVLIEHAGDDEISVVSPTPGVRGEELTLRIGPSDSVQMTMTVRTLQSEPVLNDTRLRYRIRLAIVGAIALSSGVDVRANSWRPGDRTTGVFVRRYPVRVLNVSRGGCLLDLEVRLPVGAVGTLHCGDRHTQAEPVRVSYQQERRGGAKRHIAGAEFLSLVAPSSRSLRAMAVRMEAESTEHLAESGEESGAGLISPTGGAFDIMAIVCAAQSMGTSPDATLSSEIAQPKAGRALALVGGKTPQPGH